MSPLSGPGAAASCALLPLAGMLPRILLALFTLGVLSAPALAQDADRLIADGDSLLAQGDPQKALGSYDAALRARPDARSRVARARALYALDHLDSYLLDVETALRLDSTLPEAHYQRAIYALRSQDHQRAIRHCDSALRHGATGPLRAKTLVCRGEALAEVGRNEEALEDLRQGIDTTAMTQDGMATLARLLDANGRYAEALPILERLCELDPKDVSHWTNRGFELAMLGRHKEALAIYDKALEIDKDEPVALSDRAFSLMMLGRKDEAMKNVERSLRYYPSNAFALRTHGILLAELGLKEKACEDLRMARLLGGVQDIDRLIEQNCTGNGPRR